MINYKIKTDSENHPHYEIWKYDGEKAIGLMGYAGSESRAYEIVDTLTVQRKNREKYPFSFR